jgi:phage shock protein E
MKGWISENKGIVFGVIFGAVAGYAYYHFIGCNNGQCLISSKPLNSTLYFGLMGGLLLSIFKKGPRGKAN